MRWVVPVTAAAPRGPAGRSVIVRVALCNRASSRVDRPAARQRAMASALVPDRSAALSGALAALRGASPPAARSVGNVPQVPAATRVTDPKVSISFAPAVLLVTVLFAARYESTVPVPSSLNVAPVWNIRIAELPAPCGQLSGS